jgi:NTE family protein
MNSRIKNLVFEGGGVKGIALLGALKFLKEIGELDQVERVGGTSAGAINALFLGLGLGPEESIPILKKMDFNSFLDDESGMVRDLFHLFKNFGWHKGDVFKNFIKDIIQKQTGNANATFEDIEKMKAEKGFLDMTFVGTNISTGQVVFYNNYFTPKMKLCDAIRISMSIPFFFEAIRTSDGVLIDGGMVANYPIKLFDKPRFLSDKKNLIIPDYYANSNKLELEVNPNTDGFCLNPETLGFRLDSKREIKTLRDSKPPPKVKIDSFKDFTKALIKTLIDAQQANSHLESDDWKRTVYIDTLGVGTTDFDISDHKKDKLIQSGYDCAKKYFAWKNGLKLVA